MSLRTSVRVKSVHSSSSLRRHVYFLILLTLSGLVSGCFGGLGQTISHPSLTPNGPTGGIAMKAMLASGLSDGQSISRVTATLKRGNQELKQDLTLDLDSMTASGSIPKLLIGTWQLRVDVYDQQEGLLYTGVTSVLIEEGKTTGVDLPLVAAPGKLILRLDVGDFGSYELVKGKVIIGTGEQPEIVQEFARGETDELLVTIKELAPRSHDLRIELYKNTFHSYNCIYQGPWEVITIRTGKTTEVDWNPAWGCIEIIGIIDAPPPSPTDITASVQEDGILVSWSSVRPVEDDLEAYRLYTQIDAFSGFQIRATVPKTMNSYFYRPELSSYPNHISIPIQISVSSLDTGGNESRRSTPVTVSWYVVSD